MISKMISVILVAALPYGSLAAQTSSNPSQGVAQMQHVLHKAQEKNKAVSVTLSKKIDNHTKVIGKVSEVTDTGFTLTEQRTGSPMRLAYDDVRQVKQKGMSKGAKIAMGVGIGAAAFLAVGIIVCYAAGPCRE